MTRPCVVGRELAEAQRLLAEAGVTVVSVRETAPPAGRRPTGPTRVLRQREEAEGVSLVVAASVPLPGEADGCQG